MRRLPVSLWAGGGYYIGLTQDSGGEPVAGGNPFVSAGAEVSYRVTTNLGIGLGGSWTLLLGQPQALASSVSARLGVSWRIPLGGSEYPEEPFLPERPALLELSSVEFDDLLPVFYQYYDTHPIGHAVLENGEPRAARDIAVSVFIRSYMDSPKTTTIEEELAPGKTLPIDLLALFSDEVLAITEGTKASVEITLTYTVGGSPRRSQLVETVFLNHRNASIWDDDRRAAAFVTARDPAVLRLAKSVAGVIGDREGLVVDSHLATAMALHQALGLYGLRYVVDPKTPYKDLVSRKQDLDFLQFPRQTLDYKAGDCDDLTTLFCAALEAVDIETAFITIPGHIYAAFALDMSPEMAKSVLRRPEDLVIEDGKAWVPVEITEIKGGFLKAWTLGAKQWRENAAAGRAKLHPVRAAWTLFAPVGLPGEGEAIALPQAAAITKSYLAENTAFAHQQVDDRAAMLQQEIARAKDKNPLINKLGVLYARFGLLDQAEKEFRKAIVGDPHTVVAHQPRQHPVPQGRPEGGARPVPAGAEEGTRQRDGTAERGAHEPRPRQVRRSEVELRSAGEPRARGGAGVRLPRPERRGERSGGRCVRPEGGIAMGRLSDARRATTVAIIAGAALALAGCENALLSYLFRNILYQGWKVASWSTPAPVVAGETHELGNSNGSPINMAMGTNGMLHLVGWKVSDSDWVYTSMDPGAAQFDQAFTIVNSTPQPG